MKVSYNWLKEFVEVDVSAEELAEKLTMAGLEVERVEYFGRHLEGIVVGKIMSIERHPNADKLVVCDVDVGKERLQIVCGAKNMKVGDKVPVAFPGQRLRSMKTNEYIELKRAKIRGVESQGMMCSEVELDLGDDAAGLMILPEDLKMGEDFAKAMNLHDAVFNIDVTPNRPDCLSIIGVAREAAAILGKNLAVEEPRLDEKGKDIGEWTSVTIEDYDLCPRYAARVIADVEIKSSPLWLQQKLEKAGIRAINNVVDVTNYVMMEMGQPLHCFDYDKLRENRIVVRRARKGEKILTLDAVERELTDDMLVIADAERAVAIAGVMGGGGTEIDNNTKTILLESAYFNPSSVRRTSKRLGLVTESSYRFERGADPDAQVKAADRAAQLIGELSGGKIQKGVIDVREKGFVPSKVSVRVQRVNDILGTKLSQSEIESILSRLNFAVVKSAEGVIEVEAPSYRVDLQREIDYIEEVARIYGYENIPTPISMCKIINKEPNVVQKFEEFSKNILTSFGFYEIIGCNLISKKSIEKIRSLFFEEKVRPLEVLNPKSAELNVLRPTLVVGMLEAVGRNEHQNRENIRIFEIGHIHLGGDGEFPLERRQLSLALTGKRGYESWNTKYGDANFFDLKGIIEEYFERLDIHNYNFSELNNSFFRRGSSCTIWIGDEIVGAMGEVGSELCEYFDIKTRVFLAEINCESLYSYVNLPKLFRKLPVFPGTSRDIAIVVEEELSYEEVFKVFDKVNVEILEGVRLFDIYRGKQVGKGKKSLAFSLQFRSESRTLKDEEVEKAFSTIRKKLIDELGCEVRER